MRDMSPRLSRALAFGLLTIGPVGANFLANFVAGATLPIYHTWQSQIWIMGFFAIAMYIPIVLWLCDLSPALRMQIMKTEIQALAAEGRLPTASELPSSTGDAFRRLLGHLEVWLLVIGTTANLTLYFAIQGFGPLMFTEAFHYTPAEAAKMNEYFWLANLAALVMTGLVSDRLQTRKPIAIFGATLASILMAWWIPTFGHELPRATLAAVASLMGCFLAIGYVPWAAQFSETLEDVSPALQATGWAFFGLSRAGGWQSLRHCRSTLRSTTDGVSGSKLRWRNDNLHRRDGVHSRPCGGRESTLKPLRRPITPPPAAEFPLWAHGPRSDSEQRGYYLVRLMHPVNEQRPRIARIDHFLDSKRFCGANR